MDLSYGVLKTEDLAEAMVLEQRYFVETCTMHYEMLSHLMNSGVCFKCTVADGRIVGFVKAEIDREKNVASLDVVCVSAEHRGLGIAKRLIRLSIDAICRETENRISEIFLLVSVENTRAIDLYGKMGFSVAEQIPDAYPNGGAALKMKYDLSISYSGK